MKKHPPASRAPRFRNFEPFDKRSLDRVKFKADLTEKDMKQCSRQPRRRRFPLLPIETLSCTKTIGRGRTNLT